VNPVNNKEKQVYINKKIVDGLFCCLKKMSLEDLTADEIAKESNVSKRTLYKYYSSKKEMYLAMVLEAFRDLSCHIKEQLSGIAKEDPWEKIACIGREYMRFALTEKMKAKLILEFIETDYMNDFEDWVFDIQKFSNQFELMPYIHAYYAFHQIKPPASIQSLSLYLWSETQGVARLLLLKREWVKGYYQMDEEQLIDEHLKLSKRVLGEAR